VLACATVAGVGLFGAPALDFLAGMGRESHEEFGAALAGPTRRRHTGEQVAAALGDPVSPVDAAALTGEFAAYVAALFRQALADGIWGWFDDYVAFTRPWGVRSGWYRRASCGLAGGQDRMVPFDHGRWLAARLPSAKAKLLSEEGHLSMPWTSSARSSASWSQALPRLVPERLAIRWQSGRCNRAGRDATGRTADRTRPAAMLQDGTRQTGRVSLLIRRLQVRVLPGTQKRRSEA
jgi:hypothetical protein